MKIIASEISYLVPPFSSSNTWLQLFNILIIISFFQTILPSDFQFERDMLTSPTFLLCWLFSNLLWNTTFILINLSQLYSFVAVLFTFFKLCWIFFAKFSIMMYHIFACELLFIIFESLRWVTFTKWTPGHPGKHREILSWERKNYSSSCKFLEFYLTLIFIYIRSTFPSVFS